MSSAGFTTFINKLIHPYIFSCISWNEVKKKQCKASQERQLDPGSEPGGENSEDQRELWGRGETQCPYIWVLVSSMSGVCRRWHRRLWDGGKLVASQGRNNTTLLTNSTTINTNTATSTSPPLKTDLQPDSDSWRPVCITQHLQTRLPGISRTCQWNISQTNEKRKHDQSKVAFAMHGVFATNIDHLLNFLVPFWKIIYQMLSAEWCARLCQDWSCRHHWRWSERHLTVLVNNISTWCQERPLYFFVCRLPRDL